MTTLRIMAAIAEGRRYGLDLVTNTGLPSGTIYPVLGRLQRRGWIEGHWEDQRHADREGRPRRKYYAITAAGLEVLREAAAPLGSLAEAVDLAARRA
jgi:DNA-binding PadR family transcriptional regulator